MAHKDGFDEEQKWMKIVFNPDRMRMLVVLYGDIIALEYIYFLYANTIERSRLNSIHILTPIIGVEQMGRMY